MLRMLTFPGTSSALAGLLSDETGTGAVVLANSPAFAGSVTITGTTTDANAFPLILKDSSDQQTVRFDNTGRCDLTSYAGGSIMVLTNKASPVNNARPGHFALATLDSNSHQHTAGIYECYITDVTATSLDSKLSLWYMDAVNGEPGGTYAYQQPNKRVDIDATGVNWYRTTDTTNYERFRAGWDSGNGMFCVLSEKGGTGTSRAMIVGTQGNSSLLFLTNNTGRWWVQNDGHFSAISDNTYDIGLSGGSRPRNIYAAGAVTGSSLAASAANGQAAGIQFASESLTLSTSGTTTDTSANLLPANSIILSVMARITTTITTATNWQLGDPTTAGRFTAANSTLTAGTTDVGLKHMQGSITTDAAGPVQTTAAKVRVTTTGTPGAGVVRITVAYIPLTAPTS